MHTIDLVYFDAGGGHRSAARAIMEAASQQGYSWTLRMLNLQEVLDPIDICRRTSGRRMQDLYNWSLRNGWTQGSAEVLRLFHFLVRLTHDAQVRLFEATWRERKPDLVVSLIPHFNRALHDSLSRTLPGTPLVTILTDIADTPPHFWIERQEQFIICGSERALEQAKRIGFDARFLRRTSGMILHPEFYRSDNTDRAAKRKEYGLDPNMPTGVVLFGGYGSRSMVTIAKRVSACRRPVQLIMLCGRNEKLVSELRGMRGPAPMLVQPFTTQIPQFLRLADFFLGKPGPGCVSEALKLGLPVIVESSGRTMVQERYNVEWVVERGVGFAVRDFKHVDRTIHELLDPATFARLRRNISGIENRAVFEILAILDEVAGQRHAEHTAQCERSTAMALRS
jgi:1,2-diacylglycerol 3-beta-galactosyltransferase